MARISAATLHAAADEHNWDDGTAKLRKILANPLCDRGTALLIYWRGAPAFYLSFATPEAAPTHARDVARLLFELERRLMNDGFATNAIGFDPKNDRGTDHTKLKKPEDAVREIPQVLCVANAPAVEPAVDAKRALLKAIGDRDAAGVRQWLAAGAKGDAAAGELGTPLHYAARVGTVEIVELLLDAGAKVDKRARGRTPLTSAGNGGRLDIARALVARGAKASNVTLQWCVWGNEETFRYLIERGADIHRPDEDGETPLYWAATLGRVFAVKILLSLGADPSVRRRKDGKCAKDKVEELILRAEGEKLAALIEIRALL